MEQLNEFWALVSDVWTTGVAGIDVSKGLTAIGIFLGFVILRGLFTKIVISWLKEVVQRSDNKWDDRLVEVLDKPVRFIPLVMGVFFAFHQLELEGVAYTFGENFVRSLIAFNIFWGFFLLVGPLSAGMTRLERIFTAELVEWLVKATKVLVVFLGAATVLEIWGIEVGPLLAGLGLFGVAVALGAQDLFKNLIAGILILSERRFAQSDWIRVDGVVEGVVETIGFRSTLIRRFDKAPVFVPNAHLSDTAVTNFSQMTYRRIYWKIGVEYRTTTDQLREIRQKIEDAIMKDDAFAKPPAVPTFVRIDSFNDSSIDFMIYCFTKTTNWGEWLEIRERLAYSIKDIIEGAGAAFAFPSTSLYVEALPGDGPETFMPPTEKTGKAESQKSGDKSSGRNAQAPTPKDQSPTKGEDSNA